MDAYLDRLRAEGLSLLILRDDEAIFSSREEGMRPLVRAIEGLGLERLRGCVVMDRVVGKAAALSICLFGASEVHCGVISERAIQVFEKRRVPYYAERTIPEVMDRSGRNVCPFERSVLDVDEPEAGFERLCAKLREMRLEV